MALKDHLSELLSSDGWVMVEKKFQDKIADLNRLDGIDKTLSSEQKLIEIDGRQKAIKIIEDVLQELKMSAKFNKLNKQELL